MLDLNLLVLQFLLAISSVESNNGQNIQHKIMTSGIHQGDTAIGRFGLMPNTIKLLKKSPEKVQTKPSYEFEVARQYAIKLLQKAQGDPYKASVLWLRGPSAKPTPADYKTSRFKKFKLIFDSL